MARYYEASRKKHMWRFLTSRDSDGISLDDGIMTYTYNAKTRKISNIIILEARRTKKYKTIRSFALKLDKGYKESDIEYPIPMPTAFYKWELDFPTRGDGYVPGEGTHNGIKYTSKTL